MTDSGADAAGQRRRWMDPACPWSLGGQRLERNAPSRGNGGTVGRYQGQGLTKGVQDDDTVGYMLEMECFVCLDLDIRSSFSLSFAPRLRRCNGHRQPCNGHRQICKSCPNPDERVANSCAKLGWTTMDERCGNWLRTTDISRRDGGRSGHLRQGRRWMDERRCIGREIRTFQVMTELEADIYAKDDDDGRTLLHWPRTMGTLTP